MNKTMIGQWENYFIRRNRETATTYTQTYWLHPADFIERMSCATMFETHEDAEAERQTLRDNPDANLTEADEIEIVHVRITVEEITEP